MLTRVKLTCNLLELPGTEELLDNIVVQLLARAEECCRSTIFQYYGNKVLFSRDAAVRA